MCEHEALLRMMLVDMVEELGHQIVAEAGHVADALVLAETAQFDLALLDINVGGVSVGPVALAVERRGLPIVFVSGYQTTGLSPPFHQRSVLRKPYTIEELKRGIETALVPANRNT